MGRRDRDPRPPVEVIGVGDPAEAPRRVEIGREGRSSRARWLLAAGAVAALLVAGLSLGGDDDERGVAAPGLAEEERDNAERRELKDRTTTSRRPRPTTTTTATTLPAGPVLPTPTGAGLLLLTGQGVTATYLDLDTGERREIRLPGFDGWSTLPVTGGVVTVGASGVLFVPLPEGEPTRELGDGQQIFASGHPERVWILRNDDPQGGPPQIAQLVDLDGRPITGEIRVPTCCPVGGVGEGIAFTAGNRTYVADDGGVRPLTDHQLLRASDTHLVVLACDDRAACSAELVERSSGRAVSLGPVDDPASFGLSAILSDDGHVALVSYGPQPTLAVHAPDGHRIGAVPGVDLRAEPAWLPGGHGLVVTDAQHGAVRYVERDGALVAEPIAALADEYRDRILVIPP